MTHALSSEAPILLVEPDPDLRCTLAEGLTRDGMTVAATRLYFKDGRVKVELALGGSSASSDASGWFSDWLGKQVRLVHIADGYRRKVNEQYAVNPDDHTGFADGYPILLTSEEGLQDLNSRLESPLPMNRFRPNIVIAGVEPFEEDDLETLSTERVALRPVKPCTRCAITTTDQQRGERDGEEPLRTLRSFRFNRELKGVAFGQNAVLIRGAGEWLEVGQELRVERRAS